MAFIPAHDAIVMFKPEPGDIEESTNGTTPAKFKNDGGTEAGILTIPVDEPHLLGYTDFPEFVRGLNNSKGFSIGKQGASYNKRGRREPSITVNIRPGNLEVLDQLFPGTNGRLPNLAIFVITKNVSCDHFRFCKPSSVAFNFSGGEGEGGELTIAVTFQATAHIHEKFTGPGPHPFPTPTVLRSLGEPLMWHDVRGLSLTSAHYGESPLPLRRAVSSLSVTLDMGLERKNERPYWGDHVALSSTSYDMLEHHKTVTGEMTLHERLPAEFFHTADLAQNWGDLEIECANHVVDGVNTSKSFALKLFGCFPTDEKSAGGESSKELDYNVSFAADDIALNPSP